MRIAVACSGLDVSPTYAQCASFTFYTIRCGVLAECQNVPNPRLSTARLGTLFADLGVSAFIVGAIDRESRGALVSHGVEVVDGVHGPARHAVDAYLRKTLSGHDDELDAMEA